MNDNSLTEISDDRQVMAIATLAQRKLAEIMTDLTPLQNRWLRWRALSNSDIEARHLAGKPRGKDMDNLASMKLCGCMKRQRGWIDLREATVLTWKKQDHFTMAYLTMMNEPVIYAATLLEQAAPIAANRLRDIVANEEGKVGDQIRASKIMLEADGIIQTVGTLKPTSGVQNSLAFRLAEMRAQRGLELSIEERKMLSENGIETVSIAAGGERTLDGELVELPD